MKSINVLLLLILYVVTSLFGLYKLKSEPLGLSMGFVLGFVSYAAGFCIWLGLLRALPLSVAFPIAAGALAVGTQLVGWAALHETASPQSVFGVLLIVAGIFLLAVKKMSV
jgi:multidrug transporter EmrE-like cation transporter